ncbi:hypothetical protein [Nocardia seriolae]|uniref:Uncharacterized protein n=1 Tax=Nocardia seriolae TaxID=37332 RepID=A0A0B8N9F9_9NOCA|nr:hypothetical protein [Nocardia seriolae]APA96365.1 hypothetical protein NS506_02299 [Nocardia seriolae]MTJ71707.1 hypothetical protein [Nocardia seriolae]MTJ86472.1 hypothetical protein [Nocardia seriolae]MTK39412.1 hypothetical protein [Nocardia seriolae]MTK47036.1 hypothetical protein [Nocardia seriolae]
MAFINFSRNPLTVLSVLGERRSRSALTASERANLRASRAQAAIYSAALGVHPHR